MKKERFLELKKIYDEADFGMKPKEFLVFTIFDEISNMIDGYENTISDMSYDLEEANEKFYKNAEELIKGITENVDYELMHRGLRADKKLIREFVVASLNYEYRYLVVGLVEGMMLSADANLGSISFTFEGSWAL